MANVPQHEWPIELRQLLAKKIGDLAKNPSFTNPTNIATFPFPTLESYEIAKKWAYEAYQLGYTIAKEESV